MTRFVSTSFSVPFVVTAALTLLVAGCGEYSNPNYAGPRPFDAALWLRGETSGMTDSDAPRLRMADGLVEGEALMGKPRPQIEEMLGPPTRTSKFSNYDLVYWLGPERGFMSIDSEWLVITFNASGIVEEAKIVRD